MRKDLIIIGLLLLLQNGVSYSQTLQVSLSPDKSKVDRNAQEGKATVIFDSNIEDLSIVCTDENPDEPIVKVTDNLWYMHIDAKKDIESDGICYRNFLLKSSSSAEYYLTTEPISPKQVLYYTVFLPEIAGGVPIKVNASFDLGFDRGNYPENVIGLVSTLSQHRLGFGCDTINVYRNLRENQYDQVYSITPKGIINNLNVGDILTFIPNNESFNSISLTLTDSIFRTNEVKLFFLRKRHSLRGYVIDEYNQKPVQNCKVNLFLGSYEDTKKDFWGNYFSTSSIYNKQGYRRNYETGESLSEYSTEKNGYFGWKDCIIDYTYYITVKPPRGYARIGFNDGVNIKPKDNVNDSLTIRIKPVVVKGIVTDGKKVISDVGIECETLYGKIIATTGQDGRFEIIGPTSEFIRFVHNDFRVMDVKFDDYYLFQDEVFDITINMRKGNRKIPFKGEYKWGDIKEIK